MGGTFVAVVGGGAALFVVAILAFTVFGSGERAAGRGVSRAERSGSREAAVDSPLYRSGGLSRVGCRLPPIREHDPVSMNRFLDTLSTCLDRSWAHQFAKAGVGGFAAPQRVFWSSPGKSPCGSYPAPGAAAFYCPANDTMYVGLTHVVETAGNEPVAHYAVYARVIAHEYGHHVQEGAGILGYGHQRMATGDVVARTEASRRIELQAQCLAGAFLSAERATLPMTREQYRAMIDDVLARGDDRQPPDRRDHGSGRHYAGWTVRGYNQRVLSSCNTWTVSPESVS